LSGLAKTAAQEWPKAVVRTIDLAASGAAPEAVAVLLAAELLHGGADREIGLTADGGRCAFVSTEKAASGGAPVVTPELGHRRIRRRARRHRRNGCCAGSERAPSHRPARPHHVLEEEPAELRTYRRRRRAEEGAAGRGDGQRPSA
jgi:hypothetical protein